MLQQRTYQRPSQLDAVLRQRASVSIPKPRIPQSSKSHNPKWSDEEQQLIDWVSGNFHIIATPLTKPLWEKIQKAALAGPAAKEAKDFLDGLLFMRQVIEQEIAKRNAAFCITCITLSS